MKTVEALQAELDTANVKLVNALLLAHDQTIRCNALVAAATNLLKKLGNMTTLEFSTGADYAEREALWNSIEAAQAQQEV